MTETKNYKNLTVRVSMTLDEKIREQAYKEKTNKAALFRKAMTMYLDQINNKD